MYSAQALVPVAGYSGRCGLGVTDSAITITAKERIGEESLGTWPLDCIRRFTSRVGKGWIVGWLYCAAMIDNDLIYTVDFRSF